MENSQQTRGFIFLWTLLLFLVAGVLCGGCVAYPHPTPEVKGSVIDATTKKPIAGARIEVRKHSHIHCETAADGSFDLPANHFWKFCFLMSGDYLVIAPLSITSTNHQVFTNDYLGGRKLVVLDHPIELQKESHP